MRKVVDSNMLRDCDLDRWLRRSRSNIAVLTDYLAMEALKGDAPIGARKSMKILSGFPGQVAILKSTTAICGLAGVSRGLQRRMIDHPQSKGFGQYCKTLFLADNRSTHVDSQLKDLADTATRHFKRVEKSAEAVRSAGVEIAKTFSPADRRVIRAAPTWPTGIHARFVSELVDLSRLLFDSHPSVTRPPSPHEIIHTYLFRSALISLLLVFEYADDGGLPNRATHRLVNDLSDTHFATYATFFDGLITKDERQLRLYRGSQNALGAIREKVRV